ncbi:MAG: lysophospholipid acyltransferase family protein [Planctomycetota bacterium]
MVTLRGAWSSIKMAAIVRWTRIVQKLLGVLAVLVVYLPYVRRVHGRIPQERRLYVCNHVSLLDTLILGAMLFVRGRTPILVLGDRDTWRKSRLRTALSRHVGFLIDRGAVYKSTMERLREFGASSDKFELIVFPEGTRGDGRTVAPCQPGVYFIARAAGVPIVPVFLEGVEKISSKHGPRRLVRGLRSVEIHVGEEFTINGMKRNEFCEAVRRRLTELSPSARS